MEIEHRPTLPDAAKILFAETYIKTSSRVKATIAAGGVDFSEDLETIDLIKEFRETLRQRAHIDLESHLEQLVIIRDAAMDSNKVSVALGAEIARGKAAGLYIERTKIDINELSNLSSTELRKRLQELADLTDLNPVKHIEAPNNEDAVTEAPFSRDFSEVARRTEPDSGSSSASGGQ